MSGLFAIPWTAAYQALPSMGFSRKEYWSGVPLPFLGDLPDPGIEPRSPTLQADALPSKPPRKSYQEGLGKSCICTALKRRATGRQKPGQAFSDSQLGL